MRYFPLAANNLDHFLNDVFRTPFESDSDFRALINPPVDVEENETHYFIKMDIPGVNKEEVKIEVLGEELVVSGERRSERDEFKKNAHFQERKFGSFKRHFKIGNGVDLDKIEAKYNNGVVEISLAKSEAKKSKEIKLS